MIWNSLMNAKAKLKEKLVEATATLEKAATATLVAVVTDFDPEEEGSICFFDSCAPVALKDSVIFFCVSNSSCDLLDHMILSASTSVFSTNMETFMPTTSGLRSNTRLSLMLLLGIDAEEAIATLCLSIAESTFVTKRGVVISENLVVEFKRKKSNTILRPLSFSHRAVASQSKYRTYSSVVHTRLFAANICFEKHSQQLCPSAGRWDLRQFLSIFEIPFCEPPPAFEFELLAPGLEEDPFEPPLAAPGELPVEED